MDSADSFDDYDVASMVWHVEQLLDDDEALAEWMDRHPDDWFLCSVRAFYDRTGFLTPRQRDAIRRIRAVKEGLDPSV